jgi:hypothetical protein
MTQNSVRTIIKNQESSKNQESRMFTSGGQYSGQSGQAHHQPNPNDLKNYLMTMLLVDSKNSSFIGILYNYIIMTILDTIIKYIPQVVDKGKKWMSKEPKSVIILSRSEEINYYAKKHLNLGTNNETSVVKMQDISTTEPYYSFLFPEKMVNLTPDIQCILTKSDTSSDNIVKLISYTLDIDKLKSWLLDICKEYRELNNTRFFYELVSKKSTQSNGTDTHKITAKALTHNKNFNNLYGKHIKLAKEYIDFFLNNKESFYDRLGNPYTLGFLLHGPPGTGKTSFIKAVSKYTQRNILSIDLKIANKRVINNLFAKGCVDEHDNTYVSISKSIIIFEDIDCVDSAMDRGLLGSSSSSPKEFSDSDSDSDSTGGFIVGVHEEINTNGINGNANVINGNTNGINGNNTINANNVKNAKKIEKDFVDEKIDLAFLLNLLDGVIEYPGRMIIMTSNYPEKIDKALLRPGRIDFQLNFDYADNEMAADMFENFFGIRKTFENLDNRKITAARLNQIMCENFKDHVKAYEAIMKLN